MGKFLSRKKVVGTLAILGVLGGIAWWQQEALLAHYCVWQLVQANEANREEWLVRVIALDEAAVPVLIDRLQSADRIACEPLEHALVGLAQSWGPEDSRGHQLLMRLLDRHEACKAEALRVCALRLAAGLAGNGQEGPWLDRCRILVLDGLSTTDADTRIASIQLVLCSSLRQSSDVLEKIVPLLKDNAVGVRKAALVALGPARAAVHDDDLLFLLHDADDEVRGLCELALRSRGLTGNHILLARLISDERPGARLRVLQHLRDAPDLEPGVWLRRLCQDSAPAVRAAAIRAAATQAEVDMRPCLVEMAQQDANLTVRQLAGYYLTRALFATTGDN